MNGREPRSANADFQCERKNRQTRMVVHFLEPFFCCERWVQFPSRHLDRDFEGADIGDVKRLNCIDLFEGRTGEFFAARRKPRPLAISRSGNNVTITWPAGTVLQEATSVMGPFNDVPGAPSTPITVPATGTRFYRFRF